VLHRLPFRHFLYCYMTIDTMELVLIRSNKMQKKAGIYYCKLTLHVSGVYRPHHQEYIKLQPQPLIQVISHIRATTFCQHGLIKALLGLLVL